MVVGARQTLGFTENYLKGREVAFLWGKCLADARDQRSMTRLLLVDRK